MNIVEVTSHIFRIGDVIHYEEFENGYLFEKYLDDTIKDYIPKDNENIIPSGNVIFIDDNIGFSFRWVGDCRCHDTIIDILIAECGIEDIFGDNIEYFVELTKKKLTNKKLESNQINFNNLSLTLKQVKDVKHLKFLLKYKYKSWSSFNGEYDDSFECLGELK